MDGKRTAPPQTPGEDENPVQQQPLPPGEEAGEVGEESRGGPMKHQGVGPGDPHTGGDK